MADFICDPRKTYLLCRPRGGFNDAMVQIEKCRLYAIKYNRVLLIDTTRSGIRMPFQDVFTPQEHFGCEVLGWTDGMIPAFDALTSVYPREICHRISSYETEWVPQHAYYVDTLTGCELNFDAAQDHSEQLIVYEQAGGGPASFAALDRLCLVPQIARLIVDNLRSLSADFDAIHIRHSDYKTDFATFLTRLRSVLRGRSVLICSDSAQAISAAAEILHPTTTVFGVTQTPDLGGVPLHNAATLDRTEALVDLLSDLFALALSRRLFFTAVNEDQTDDLRISGFSLLAFILNKNPDTVKRLLAAADPSDADRLFARTRPAHGPVQWLRFAHYLHWNRHVVTQAHSRNRRARRQSVPPERIGARYVGNP
ncbi:hypothetical protein SAMN04488005_0731 [Yoonia tamlensis]|uniref:Uncharacterized protein n=1 Tax=Yoonia tamlensis TaxID=390270 RepID=A0A1I6FYA8_9RHOB|nr:hypothetical protein [Yoonia tamlensis]SFR34925.1 hypothetical protein SAMN04488005_0731 [Yoonia tamlensis]